MISQKVIDHFIRRAGWAEAKATILSADFSSRKIVRLERPDGMRAILMGAAPDQKTTEFVAVAALLQQMDIAAPAIYAAAADLGLVIMADFGDTTLGRRLDEGGDKPTLFRRATSILVQMHHVFRPRMAAGLELPIFDRSLFVSQVELFLDGYFSRHKQRAVSPIERETFCAAWLEVLAPVGRWPQTLMLRDYMLDNLMDLPVGGTGVLDFQDAGLGPLPYDLASLCENVRRDGGLIMLDEVLADYCQANPAMMLDDLRQACRLLSAQRHTRILGIIAQLAEKPGHQDKLAYQPRIWNTLEELFQDKPLLPVKLWFDKYLPRDERV